MSAKRVGAILVILTLVLVSPVLAKGPKHANPHRKAGNALPDQDGKGMDRGLPSSDKEADGGDWDNGCGNEFDPADREDDNNGRCGPHKTPAPTETPVPIETPTPVVTPSPSPTPPPPAIIICWKGSGSVEVWDEKGKFLDEDDLMTEDLLKVCWTAEIGRSYFILDWTPLLGHSGSVYTLTVPDIPAGTYFPQLDGSIEYEEYE